VDLRFEWDEAKAGLNFEKHGVGFDEAVSIFGDPLTVEVPDPDHSSSEDRFIAIGYSRQGRLLVVVHSDHENVTRIISARGATRRERDAYEEGRI
jgi:uncharacterized DUF497 family protein